MNFLVIIMQCVCVLDYYHIFYDFEFACISESNLMKEENTEEKKQVPSKMTVAPNLKLEVAA